MIPPSGLTSSLTAAGSLPSPGISDMLPQTAVTKPAPARSCTSLTVSTKPDGAPFNFGLSENEYCVFAMQTGKWPNPLSCSLFAARAAAGSKATLPARYTCVATVRIFSASGSSGG